MDYEKEQARLLQLWTEVEPNEMPDDDEEELAAEEDLIEERNSGSETEEEGEDDEVENIPPSKIPRVPLFFGKDQVSIWKKSCPNKRIRTRQENIIIRLPGVKGDAKNAKSVLECWSLFFSQEMLQKIVDNTNLYISNLSLKYKRERNAKPTDIIEMKALLGLLYLGGCLKSSRLSTEELWDRKGTGIE